MFSILQSIILGIVQGLTEFLPISSTAHLRIIPSLLNWEDPGTAYSAVIQIGTIISVIVYFFRDLQRIFIAITKKYFLHKRLNEKENLDARSGLYMLLGSIPIFVFGFIFKEKIESGFARELTIISFSLIAFGILLYMSEIISKQKKSIDNLNILDAFIIGVGQSLALIPGVSRSAITITSGLMLGYKRYDAARFSFLLSIPAVLASGALETYSLITTIKAGEELIWANLIVGIISAFISGYITIDYLLKFLQTNKTYIFVIYRILLGILVIYLNSKGFIH